MPSTSDLVLNLLLGSCGAGYLFYGRRNSHLTATLCGLLLMVVPALISAGAPAHRGPGADGCTFPGRGLTQRLLLHTVQESQHLALPWGPLNTR